MVQVGQLAEGMIKHDNESMTPPHHMDPADDDHSPRVCLYNLITVILTLIITGRSTTAKKASSLYKVPNCRIGD